jgi:hypothetical protein
MRALVKETMSRKQVDRLTRDLEDACRTLDEKGGTTQIERNQGEAGVRLPGPLTGPDHSVRPAAATR